MTTTETPQSISPLAPMRLYFIAPVNPVAPNSLLTIWSVETALPVIFDAWVREIISRAGLPMTLLHGFDRQHWSRADRLTIIASLDQAGVAMHYYVINDFNKAKDTLLAMRVKERGEKKHE